MRTTMRWSDTSYPAVRRVMGPERERMNDEALEDLLGDLFPEAAPSDVEDFMRSLQTFGKQVAPLAQRALPGIIQGATTGATVAGPWGAVAGAIGGGAASLLGGGGARSAPRAQPPAPRRAAATSRDAIAACRGARPAGACCCASGRRRCCRRDGGTSAAAGPAVAPRNDASAAVDADGRRRQEHGQGRRAGRTGACVRKRNLGACRGGGGIRRDTCQRPTSGYLFDPAGNPRCDIANPAERASLLARRCGFGGRRQAEEFGATTEPRDDIEWSAADEAFEESDPLDSYEAALEGRLPMAEATSQTASQVTGPVAEAVLKALGGSANGEIVRQLISNGGSAAAFRSALKQARLTPEQQSIAELLLAVYDVSQELSGHVAAGVARDSDADRIDELEKELADLRQVNDTVAAALGACPICWGGDLQCHACQGHGRAGFTLPACDLFQELVAPAVKRVMRARRGRYPAEAESRR